MISTVAFKINLRRYITVSGLGEGITVLATLTHLNAVTGRAVQVDPMKPTLKAPGSECLQLKYAYLLSTYAFKFNLRRYTPESTRNLW